MDPLQELGPRPQILVGPPMVGRDSKGRMVLAPNVLLTDDAPMPPLATPRPQTPILEGYPAPAGGLPGQIPIVSRAPSFWDDWDWQGTKACRGCGPIRSLLGRYFGPPSGDGGLGRERLANALFEIDTTQPLNNMRIRIDMADNWQSPDRAEYLWASPGLGPSVPESSADFQDLRLQFEFATARFSVATELPLRFMDPATAGNPNTAGFGDMNLTTKTVLFDGDAWQCTQLFRTIFNTGNSRAGLGTGHISMDLGLLVRYIWSDTTYLHGQATYLFPLGGNPNFAGNVFRYGLGLSTVYYENDAFALVPTMELVGWSVTGGQSLPVNSLVDSLNIINFHPGVRMFFDTPGDWSEFDFGLSTGIALTGRHWYEDLVRFEARWWW
jgi:hypothetical protein